MLNKTCVATCPGDFFGDMSSGVGICESTCPGTKRFADNSTKTCVTVCNATLNYYGDETTGRCVLTCPDGYFAQNDSERLCVPTCADPTWGNEVTRICITDPITQCPSDTWADNFTHRCTSLCSASQNYYGDNDTRLCDTVCPTPTFAFDGSRVCIDVCPASLTDSGFFGDAWTTPRKCYTTCQTAGKYRDVFNSRTCNGVCTFTATVKTYADPTTMSCERVCSTFPTLLFAYDTTATCVANCPTGYKDAATQSCVSACDLLNQATHTCVEKCPMDGATLLYADRTNKICVAAASCPTGTYASFDTL